MTELLLQFANFTLAFLFWVIIARAFLQLMLGDRPNVVLDLLRKVTDPIYALFRGAIPGLPARYVPWLTLVVLFGLRLMLLPLLAGDGA